MKSSRNEINENIKKTRILIFYFILIFFAIGCLIDIILYFAFSKAISIKSLIFTLLSFIGIACVYSFISFLCMNFITNHSVQGEPITEQNLPNIYNLVYSLSLASNLPMPKVYLVNDPSPNAFATGRDPEHATLSVTKGLLNIMNTEELEAVIGHELSHIKNYDIRVSTLAAALSSTIVGIGGALIFSARNMFWTSTDDNDKDSTIFEMSLALSIFILGILIKLIGIPLSQLIQFAISRQREYLADVSSTQLTHNPQGMIKALQALQNDETPTNQNLTIVRQLCLNSPKYIQTGNKIHAFNGFDTHPTLDARIKRLQQLLG